MISYDLGEVMKDIIKLTKKAKEILKQHGLKKIEDVIEIDYNDHFDEKEALINFKKTVTESAKFIKEALSDNAEVN